MRTFFEEGYQAALVKLGMGEMGGPGWQWGTYDRNLRTADQQEAIDAWLAKMDKEVGSGGSGYHARLGKFENANPWPETMGYTDITGYYD
ncbi:MAG: hypothetical protein DRP83_02290 [Planctomycetota bacterium]|nr:MAG: hypothetical protein DRP83_02290 [Planctomycetota bacterium]